MINLATNENILGAPPVAVRAASEELQRAHRYPERQDAGLLRALAAYHGVEENQVVLGNGAHHLLRVTAASFLPPGEVAVGLAPTYPGYRNATHMLHGRYEEVAAAAGGYARAPWRKAAGGARVVWLCTPNNPTGCVLRHDDAATILDSLPRGAVAVFDETYRDFVDDPEAADGMQFLRAGESVIVIRTFSKMHGLAGLRIGYALTRPDLAEAMRDKDRLDSFPVNRPGQAAAAAALRDTEHQEKTRRVVLAGRKQLQAGLDELGLERFPSQANFVTVRLDALLEPVLQATREAGYLIRSMDGPWGLPGWVRITVGLAHHNEAVLGCMAGVLRDAAGGG